MNDEKLYEKLKYLQNGTFTLFFFFLKCVRVFIEMKSMLSTISSPFCFRHCKLFKL